MATECEAPLRMDELEKKSEDDKVEEDEEVEEQQTEETKLPDKDNDPQDAQTAENGKKKVKEEKNPSKVVLRRLPPTMTEENFVEQVAPIPPYDYMYFVPGDPSNGIISFSRAYINFVNQEDIITFTQTFDGYVFLDSKGQEYPAVVEFAPFQRIPKRVKKKDRICGTIECDPAYITFKENLQAEALENAKPGSNVQQHFFETEISTTETVSTTPLLEFLKQKRAENARIKNERREEKKRKETERRMKQKIKEKKGEEEEEPKEVKLLQKEKKDIVKDRGNRRKEDKEKPVKEIRTREFKNRNNKYNDDKRFERRDERKKFASNPSLDKKLEDDDNENNEEINKEERPKFQDRRRRNSKKEEEKNGDFKSEEGDRRKESQNRRVRRDLERQRKRKEIWLKKQESKKAAQNPIKEEIKEPTKRRNSLESSELGKELVLSSLRRSSLESDNVESLQVTFVDSIKDKTNGGKRVGRKSNEKLSNPSPKEKESKRKDNLPKDRPKELEAQPKAKKEDKQKDKSGKDPRTDRRIRNKDRPSMEIYRPGMGKFSKQRFEKEKILGSSTEQDSPSHSPSPSHKLKAGE